MNLLKVLYLSSVFFWLAYVTIYPDWVGQLYHAQHPTGTFDFRQKAGGERTPIWRPPPASSVRWPWQLPRERRHVELRLARMFVRGTAGVIICGFVVGILGWMFPTKEPCAVIVIAWSLSVCLALALLCVVGIAFLSAGYGPTDPIAMGILIIGAMLGVTSGIGVYRRKK